MGKCFGGKICAFLVGLSMKKLLKPRVVNMIALGSYCTKSDGFFFIFFYFYKWIV